MLCVYTGMQGEDPGKDYKLGSGQFVDQASAASTQISSFIERNPFVDAANTRRS